MSTNLLAVLPELLLTLTGVAVMMLEPLIAPGKTRRPLGWLAIFGTVAAGLAAFYQLHFVNLHGTQTAFYSTLQIDRLLRLLPSAHRRHRAGHAARLAGLLSSRPSPTPASTSRSSSSARPA